MKRIQQLFQGKKSRIDLPPGEYEGPVRICHSCTVDGHGATLWTKTETALVIEAPGVTVKNLRVELTQQPEKNVAVRILGEHAQLEEVEVYGQIQGADGTVSQWELPRMVDFGRFAAGVSNEYVVRVRTSAPCKVMNQIHGVDIVPQELVAGENQLLFRIAGMMNATVLYGDFLLKTQQGILRRIYLAGRAVEGAPEHHDKPVAASQAQAPSPELRRQAAAAEPWETVVKGQRLPVPRAGKLFVAFRFAGGTVPVEVDAYAFLLYADGKARQDSDLVFFGNPQSVRQGVYLEEFEGWKGIGLSLAHVSPEVQRVVAAFAVYEESGARSPYFSQLRSPEIRLYADGKPCYQLSLQLGMEKVLTAMEFYRYKGTWKMSFVGAGFTAGLKRLCEMYGLEVV